MTTTIHPPASATLAEQLECQHTWQWRAGLRQWRAGFSELNTEPAPLIHPASDSRYRAYPWTSLLTWWLTLSQVGLSFNLQCQSKPCKEDM